jgi:SPP1 family predicted phage head-tail adaptor
MSLAQKYRHRIDLDAPGGAQDPETGEVTVGWTPFAASVPAEVVPLSGREFIQSDAGQHEVTARVEIRYMPGVVPEMRMRFDGDVYQIAAVLPDPTARKHLTLMVSRGTNDGE